MPETHIVTRAFNADRPLTAGERVDASIWPNSKQLEDQGLIKPILASEVPQGSGTVALGEVLRLLRRLEGKLDAFMKAAGVATATVDKADEPVARGPLPPKRRAAKRGRR